MALTEKQKRFCDEYLIDLNATQAAIRAGYSKKTAYAIGNENLKKLEIQKYIEKNLKAIKKDTIASAEEVIECFSSVMKNEDEATKNRLRAGELLGKYYNLFAADKNDKTTEVLDKLDKVLGGIESNF